MAKIRLELEPEQFKELVILVADHSQDPEFRQLYNLVTTKLNHMIEHDLYTKFKTAPTNEQKEEARQEYLERKGISSDFRW